MADTDLEDDEEGTGEVKLRETYELKVPFEYKGETIESVTVRRPKMKDLRKISSARGTDADKAALMIQTLCAMSPSAVDLLDGADVDGLSKVIDSFS